MSGSSPVPRSAALAERAGLPRPLLVLVIALPVLLVAGVVAVAVWARLQPADTPAAPAGDRTGPLALVPVTAPAAGSADCTALLGKLPAELKSGSATLRRRELAAPAPPGTAAWGDPAHDPVVLRCGLERPGELTPTAQLRVISDVQWLEVDGDGAATWYVVDRPVYVALTVPSDAGTGVLQDLSTTLRTTLPATPVQPR